MRETVMMGDTGEIVAKAADQGIQIAFIPLHCLAEVKADIEIMAEQNKLNSFQRWIVRERYILDLPDTDFPTRSIVVAVYPFSLTRAIFHYQGKAAGDLLEYEEKDRKAALAELVEKPIFI